MCLNAFAGSLNLSGLSFSESRRFSLLDDSLKEKFPAQYQLNANYGYVKSPFYYESENGFDGDIISYNHVLNFGGAAYIGEDWLLGLQTAMVNNKVFDKSYSSFSDSILKANWNFFKKDLNLSLLSKIFIPSGMKNNFSSRQGPGGSLSFVGEKDFNRFHFLTSLGYQYADNHFYKDIDFRELFLFQLGISYDLSEKWNVNFETYRNFSLRGQHSQNEGDYFFTGHYKKSLFSSLYTGLGVAGLEKTTKNNFSVFAGIKYAFDLDSPMMVKVILPSTFHFESRDSEKILGTLLSSDHIYFENNSIEIEQTERIKLNNVVKLYAENKHRLSHIVIEGYASQKGRAEYNLELSEKRAGKVKQLLLESGIPEHLLSIVGYGNQADLDKMDKKNRRVSFRVYLHKGKL